MGISLDMLKGPRGIDFIVHLTTLESINAKFLENDLISFRTLFMRRIIMKVNPLVQVID